uniref:DUF6598 domain-containing protein n=1 Tax=Leersia perrieri TaxID=77586 RepID=A0A0D9WJI4_9ORYZ
MERVDPNFGRFPSRSSPESAHLPNATEIPRQQKARRRLGFVAAETTVLDSEKYHMILSAAVAADATEVAYTRATTSHECSIQNACSIPSFLKDKAAHQNQKEEIDHVRQLDQLLAPFHLFEGGDAKLREWRQTRSTYGKDSPPPPHRCHRLFRIKLTVKRGQALWSHKETPRFCPEREGGFPIRLARLAADGLHLELEEDGGGQVGAISSFRLNPSQSGLSGNGEIVECDSDSPPVRLVVVIRRLPGAGGGDRLALMSNMWTAELRVRLHDKFFVLNPCGSIVTIAFSERWFRIPSNWTEEKLYARAGHDFINITDTLEDLARTLYQMYEQEEQEKIVLREKQEQERRMQEEMDREREELERRPLSYIPLGHGDMRWESPDESMHRRFRLSLGTNGDVIRCDFVEQESCCDMRWRLACYDRFVLPLTTMELQAVGFVEGFSDLEINGFIEQSGKTKNLRPVAMVSMSPHVDQIYSFMFLVDNLAIRLNDGIVLTGWSGIKVGIYCRDDDNSCAFSSSTLAHSWAHQILEWKVDDNSPISCSCLFLQLNRKLRRLNDARIAREEHDLGLSAIFALEAEQDERLLFHQKQQENKDLKLNALSLSGTQSGGGEGEGEYSLLFESPQEFDWVKVSEPYVPKFPTEEEIRKREEWCKERLTLVMEPIIQPVQEPRRGRKYFMCEPGSRSTREAELPLHESFFVLPYNWTLSDKSECFVAIRDLKDGRRNCIFNRDMDHPFTVISHGVLRLPTLSPRRAIESGPEILLEFNLKMKRSGDSIDSCHELIQGVLEHPSIYERDWSRINELSILPSGCHSTPMMRLKLAMISKGVEATVEVQPLSLPPGGIDLRCAARAGWIADDIELFDGKYGGDNTSLQFVVATELHGNMEIHLEGVCNGVSKRWSIGFVPKFHALFSQELVYLMFCGSDEAHEFKGEQIAQQRRRMKQLKLRTCSVEMFGDPTGKETAHKSPRPRINSEYHPCGALGMQQVNNTIIVIISYAQGRVSRSAFH